MAGEELRDVKLLKVKSLEPSQVGQARFELPLSQGLCCSLPDLPQQG